MFPVAILAGGLATRLRPLTETIPKALVPIRGEPFIAHQLRLLAGRGLTRVVLCLGYRAEMVQEVVGNGDQFGLQVEYSLDGPVLRGTAGAVHQAIPLLGDRFFVLYGDSYLPCDYRSVQQAFLDSGKTGLMTVYRNQGLFDTSNVEFDGRAILAYDKQNRTVRMHHIDYGLGVFHRAAFDTISPTEARDLATIYQELLRCGELAAFEVPDRFYEIGSFEGIRDLEEYTAACGQ
jgi:MurNAc alpha-1-phosphate uridylyltransferase